MKILVEIPAQTLTVEVEDPEEGTSEGLRDAYCETQALAAIYGRLDFTWDAIEAPPGANETP